MHTHACIQEASGSNKQSVPYGATEQVTGRGWGDKDKDTDCSSREVRHSCS